MEGRWRVAAWPPGSRCFVACALRTRNRVGRLRRSSVVFSVEFSVDEGASCCFASLSGFNFASYPRCARTRVCWRVWAVLTPVTPREGVNPSSQQYSGLNNCCPSSLRWGLRQELHVLAGYMGEKTLQERPDGSRPKRASLLVYFTSEVAQKNAVLNGFIVENTVHTAQIFHPLLHIPLCFKCNR